MKKILLFILMLLISAALVGCGENGGGSDKDGDADSSESGGGGSENGGNSSNDGENDSENDGNSSNNGGESSENNGDDPDENGDSNKDGDEAEEHEHTFADTWSSDELGHWHSPTCGHEDLFFKYSDHVWDDGRVTAEPSCTTLGERTYKCVYCGYEKTASISALKHYEVTDRAVPATCTESGLTEGSHCSRCETVLVPQENIPPLKHKPVDDPLREPTCTEYGFTAGSHCSVCFAFIVKQELIPAKGHTPVPDIAKEPTCTESGLTEGNHCDTCKAVLTVQEEVPPLGHLETVTEGFAATCLSAGLTDGVYCTRCKRTVTEQEAIPAHGHATVIDDEVPATCTESGLTEGSHCGECKKIIKAQEYIAPLGHTEIKLLGYLPTCNKTGLTDGVKCNTCNAILVPMEDIEKTDHTEMIIPAIEPTCLSEGKTEGKCCAVCGIMLLRADPISALGHKAEALEPKTATCAQTGLTRGERCSVCGEITKAQAVIPKLSHEYGAWLERDGRAVRDCSGECGSYEEIESIFAMYNVSSPILTGGRVYKTEITVTAILTNKSQIEIDASLYTLENDFISRAGVNNVKVNMLCLSAEFAVNAIHGNLPGTTSASEFEYTVSGGEVTITDFKGLSTTVVIPAIIENMPVTTIGASAFKDNASVVSVTVPPSVNTIKKECFMDCKSLRELVLSEGLTEIGAGAFSRTAVEAIILPDSLTMLTSGTYASGCFEDCVSLRSVVMGSGLTMIDEDSFRGCTALQSVVIGSSVTLIDIRAFSGCIALSDLSIGERVVEIGASAFAGCTALKGFTLPNGVVTIGSSAFSNCTALESVNIPGNVKTIGSDAFRYCAALSSVTLNEGLVEIHYGAFCGSLIESILIPDSVAVMDSGTLDVGVFEDCLRLRRVVIGSGLSVIDAETFRGCTSLYDVTIGSGVVTISDYAFADCTALESIHIPNNVQNIGDHAFSGCLLLGDVKLGSGLQTIGASAFNACSSLESVTIPSKVVSIGGKAFYGCDSLKDVVIEKGRLKEFGGSVFHKCSNFDRIYYMGNSSDWSKITINETVEYPLDVTPYYYTASAPSDEGNYWYYNANGQKRVWNVRDLSYKAEYYAEEFSDSALANPETSFSAELLSELEADILFKTRIAVWETLHMATDSSWENKLISQKDVYKMIIYDLLVGQVYASFNPFGATEVATVSYFNDFAQYLFDTVDVETLKKIAPTQCDLDELADVFDKVDIMLVVFEIAENAYDALLACARYQAFSDMDESLRDILLAISENTNASGALRSAAKECAECYRTANAQLLAEIAGKELLDSTVDMITQRCMDVIWDTVIKSIFPELDAAMIAAKGILFLGNEFFNIDACNEAYYQLKASVGLESAIRSVMKDHLPDYFRAEIDFKADYYLEVKELYQSSVIMGFDYAAVMLKELSVGIDSALNPEEHARYLSLIASIPSERADMMAAYENFEKEAELAYANYYS